MTMSDESEIRQAHSHHSVTFGSGSSHREETVVPTGTTVESSREHPRDLISGHRYVAPMTTASSVIEFINARRPGLKPAKQHLLLFFAQGHHLAWSGQLLFADSLTATDRGVTLEGPFSAGQPITSEGEANSIGYTLDRYGALSPADLRILIQASTPWAEAIKSPDGHRINHEQLREWFLREDETNDPDDERPSQAERAAVEAELSSHEHG